MIRNQNSIYEITKLFPNLFGQPLAILIPGSLPKAALDWSLKIGVVLSGGQAPGGHNVISSIFDYLQGRTNGSTLYGFKGGSAGIMKCKYVELATDFLYPYRNQIIVAALGTLFDAASDCHAYLKERLPASLVWLVAPLLQPYNEVIRKYKGFNTNC